MDAFPGPLRRGAQDPSDGGQPQMRDGASGEAIIAVGIVVVRSIAAEAYTDGTKVSGRASIASAIASVQDGTLRGSSNDTGRRR